MKGLQVVSKILAILCVVLLLIGLPLALFVFDLGRVVFNRDLVKRVVTDEVVNSDLIPVALEWFSDRRAQQRVDSGEALTGIDEPDIVLLMSFMDRFDWREVKKEVLLDEILTGWVSNSVDGTYAWIDSEDRVPQITWQMQPFIDRVNTEHGVNCIVIAFDNLAPCNQAEIDDFLSRQAAVPPGTEVLYNLCRFPDPWFEDQFGDYIRSLGDVVSEIPPGFALTKELGKVADTQGIGPEVLKEQLRQIRFFAAYAWLIPVVLLLLILALAIRSWKALGRWWGVPLLVSGLIVLLPALVYRQLLTYVLSVGPLSETPEIVNQEATRAILRLAAEVFRPLIIQSVVVVVIGLGLVVLYFIMKNKTGEKKKN